LRIEDTDQVRRRPNDVGYLDDRGADDFGWLVEKDGSRCRAETL
jgi:hypothetical protein